MDFTRLRETNQVSSESDEDNISLPDSHETAESGKHMTKSGKILRSYTDKNGKYKKLNLTTVDLARVVTPEKPNMHETYSRGPGHSTLLKSTKKTPKFDPQVTYVLDNDVVNPTQPPAASRIPSSQHNIPQAVPVCQT